MPTSSSPASTPPPAPYAGFYPAAPDEAAIRDAVAAASAAGGGTVLVGPGSVTLTAPLPLVSGVRYQGTVPTLLPSDPSVGPYLGDMEPNFSGGTVLVGNGGFAAFEANATAPGTIPARIGDTQISNAGVSGFAIDNFTCGLSFGAKNIMGPVWGKFADLYIKNCSQWGVRIVNFQHCAFGNIKTWICQNGQFYGNDLPAAVLMCGNSTFNELFNMVARDGRNQRLCRGVVFDGGSTDGKLNELYINRIQVNQFKFGPLSVTANATGGSNNVGVPDGTEFAVNMPVSFSAAGNGFAADTTYLVASVSGNTITLKPDVTSGAVAATGTGPLTLTSWGFPNLEITRQGGTAGVSNSSIQHADLEGGATAALYADGASSVLITLGEVSSARDGNDVVLRRSYFMRVASMNAIRTDFDADSSSAQISGQRERIIGAEGTGIWFDSNSGTRGMSLSGYSGGMEVTTGDGGIWVGPFAEKSHPAGLSSQLDPSWIGHATWGESSARAMTIIDPATSLLGDWHQLNNVGSATVTVRTASGSSPTFNKIANLRSITVPTRTWARFTCVASDDGRPFWLVVKGSLATS